MRTSNFQLWECCYWDNDLFPVGSQHSPPPPPKKKSWEWRGRVELAGNKQFCVFPSQLWFWLEIALNRTCVEGESPSPPPGGLNQSLTDQNSKGLSRNCGSTPGESMEKVRWFTPAGRAGLLGPLLRPWVQDSGLQGRRGPLPPSPSLDSSIWRFGIWNRSSVSFTLTMCFKNTNLFWQRKFETFSQK